MQLEPGRMKLVNLSGHRGGGGVSLFHVRGHKHSLGVTVTVVLLLS
jgi:hypothetical protein